ncbi:MAG: Ca-activated chloride channel family protein [Pseudoalteromonas rhizosphaerae]|jgi:Ca-activated chloride channel family protein|uniref:VWA domain-containing protein n=1 Tax=Pseudoalteromonas neustonica TaxID=1840331 RepID=A0ABY3FAR9_9GAMM|nr:MULTISPECIES: VWA domain-containing protein [Pseudoalteromonas]MBB1410950.1 VWA domain-containing protein [Pseudoalteromonas sp. SG44-17]TVU81598.1 VWA domain-containing protein [Pseudoalteromonas neustonica]
MDFEFIRPTVLWLLVPVCLVFTIAIIKHKKTSQGELIAAHLAKFVINTNNQKNTQPMWLIALFAVLAVIFSAGPSFEEKQVPVFQSKNARVIVMDMSLSMYSTDIAPSRLVQARFKALDMIKLFKEGDTALVAYAGTAYTISPLTNDAATLENLIPSLSPDIMPDKGSNVLAGLDAAKELLTQAGYLEGDIILVTDGIEQSEQQDISQFTDANPYRLNIYGIGTEQGAPIKLPEGGFLKDSYGQIVVPTINISMLNGLARNSGGKFATYQPSARDIQIFAPSANSEILKNEKQSQALWRIDAGIYGLFILLPMMLWIFRRGAFAAAFLVVSFLPQHNAYAVELPSVFKNQDQRALDAYQQGEYEQAATADSSQLKGAALYQQGNFDAALAQFSQDKSATGLYNYGNALAKAGKLDEAIAAYQQAQTLQDDFTQAKENQALVEQLKNQQQQQQNQQGQDGEQNQDQKSQDGEQGQDQQNKDKSQQGEQPNQDQQSQQGDQSKQSDDQQDGKPSDQQTDKQNEPQMEAEPEQGDKTDGQQQQDAQTEPQDDSANDDKQAQPQMTPEQQQQAEEAAKQQAMQAQTAELTNEEKEKAQQLSQLLRKVPDDPAILLRNKMQLEAQKRNNQRRPQGVEKSW